MAQRDLQAALRVEPATLSCVVDALVAKGWVQRAENPADKRSRLLRLTEDGSAVLGRISDPVQRIEARMLEGVSAAELETLRDLLERMTANLESSGE